MRSVMSHSQDSFAPYKLKFIHRQLSSNRTLSKLADGSIDSAFGSGLSNEGNQYMVELDQLRHPYLKTLHGLRRCLTTQSALEKVNNIKNLAELQSIHLGQGVNWPELKIYQHYKIKTHSGISIADQLEMLSLHRFECLPLSILEVEHVLEEGLKKHSNLVLAPNFYIFYPNPLYINLSKKNKQISKAIQFGVKKTFESGDADKLFAKHFKISKFLQDNSNLILLDNPLINEDENQSMTEYFQTHHVGKKTINITRGNSQQ